MNNISVKLKLSVIACLFVLPMYSAEEAPKKTEEYVQEARKKYVNINTFLASLSSKERDQEKGFGSHIIGHGQEGPFSLRREIALVVTANISLQKKVERLQFMRDNWPLSLENTIELQEITKYWERDLLKQQTEESKSQKGDKDGE